MIEFQINVIGCQSNNGNYNVYESKDDTLNIIDLLIISINIYHQKIMAFVGHQMQHNRLLIVIFF